MLLRRTQKSSISEKVKQINDAVYKMESSIVFFSATHQELRLDIEREAAYYVNIDYFYGLFFERCDIYIDFIMQKIMLFNLEYEKTKSSISLIHDLRTYKSHTLDKMKLHDKDVIDTVEKWHFRLTGSKKISDENYLICSNQLINLAEEILDAMLFCIRRIETDERKEHMIREMLMAKDNYCPDFYIESTTFSSRNSLNADVVYDYLIMDEASQVDIATGALALSCARNVVIVGDTKQLPNVIPSEMKNTVDSIFDSFQINEGYRYTNSFLQSVLDVMPDVTQTLLREHYRCHPKIINFCNQKFYRGELIIMTTDKGEQDVLSVVKTVVGNHARDHYSQRQIDVIKNEILPKYAPDPQETGIISPYKNQVEALRKEITDIDAATVHKFQGKEKDNIIISTVDDEISDFADDPYLINVAVSRAKKKLMLVVTGNEQPKERNITDLIDYIQYHNFEVTESKTYSVFDYLYTQYTKERIEYLKKHKKISEFDSENLMYSLIEEIIADNKYSFLEVVCHFPLSTLIRDTQLLNEQEDRYVKNSSTHLDFLIYNRISKKPVLAVEVDGYEYHKNGTKQNQRDLMKNHIMEVYGIPLLRFKTNGSGEREKIAEMLEKQL